MAQNFWSRVSCLGLGKGESQGFLELCLGLENVFTFCAASALESRPKSWLLYGGEGRRRL